VKVTADAHLKIFFPLANNENLFTFCALNH